MSRDFAKQPKNKGKKNSHKQQPASPLRWLVVGLVLGIGIALLVYFQLAGDKIPKVTLPNTNTEKAQPAKTSGEDFPAVETATKQEYEFWEMLKNKQVKVPETDQQITTREQPERRYIMQCGSFKQQEMAESLKAKIALAGFEAIVHKTDEKDGFSWHRVVLGPYTSKRKAEADRHRLNGNEVRGCRIW